MPERLRNLWPVAVLVAALAVFMVLGGGDAVSVEGLRARYADLAAWTSTHPWLARLSFVAATTALIAIGFPSVAVPMFAGGVLFGLGWGGPLSLLATATGSTIFFLASRHARAAAAETRFGSLMKRLEEGVRRDAFFYLLFIRFLPIVPTVAATLAAAAAYTPLRPFLAATFLGLIPASLIYTGIGAAAVGVLARGGEVTLAGAMLRTEVLLPLGGLIVLSLLAIVFRARIAR